jgi:hypothetical protein
VRIVNLTGHKLDIHCEDGTVLTVWPDAEPVRAKLDYVLVEALDNVGVYVQVTTCDVPLPPPVEGVVYVVNTYTRLHFLDAGRDDVYAPGSMRRDDLGRVVACRGLQKIVELTEE